MPKPMINYFRGSYISRFRPGRGGSSAALLVGLLGCGAVGPIPQVQSLASEPQLSAATDLGSLSASDELAVVRSEETQMGVAPGITPVASTAVAPSPEPLSEEAAPAKPPASHPLIPTEDGSPRLYAPSGLVKIHDTPDRDAPVIGALRAGQSVVITDPSLPHERTLRRSYQCTEGWYPVQPRGFVCVGGPGHATRDGNDLAVLAAAAALPDITSDYPFKVGTSVGAPQYLRIPTAAEQRQVEPDLDAYLANLPAPNDNGAIDTTPAGRPPSQALLAYLAQAKPALQHEQEAYEGYKIAYTQEFDAAGRTWLLTSAMTLIPKDKIRHKPLPTLKGIDLKANPDIELPLAFFWLEDSPKYRRGDDGKLFKTDEVWKRHSFVEATMNQSMGPGGLYWEMRSGEFVKYQDVTILQAAKYRPAGVGPDDKWVEARVTWGYLMAYEGDTPVYVTAMSPGVDGIARKGHATALGKHYIDWKLYTGDMSGRDGGRDWFIDEVPWVQYYKDSYALHGAYWHDDFGRPKSHGCVNLAPADARHLFEWMDPVIPKGWYAVSTYYPHTKGTVVNIRY